MKGLLLYSLLAGVVAAAPRLDPRSYDGEDECEMEWVTVSGDAPTSSTAMPAVSNAAISHNTMHNRPIDAAVASTPSSSTVPVTRDSNRGSDSNSTDAGASASPSAPQSSTAASTDESSALSLPNRPDGSAPIPLNNDHLSAPEATDAVPKDAATYHPGTPGVFDCKDFMAWVTKLKTNAPASKWMKVAPGNYRYALGPVMPVGTDPNTVAGENIAIYFMTGGWTLDLRGVTFIVDVTPENRQQRPNIIIYIDQSDGFTLLGGTVWVDQGEQWSQARVTSVSAPDSQGGQTATFEVERGYNVSAWRSAGPRNQNCVDDSNPNRYHHPQCNFWYVNNYDFSNLDSHRTFTASVSGRSLIAKGLVVSMQVGPNSFFTISSENNGDFHVKGFTTNGGFMSIGLSGKPTAVIDDYYYVNPPPRPGFAPRVQGPALNWGNIGGLVYDGPGQVPTKFTNSFWQYDGCPKDLQPGDGSTPPIN